MRNGGARGGNSHCCNDPEVLFWPAPFLSNQLLDKLLIMIRESECVDLAGAGWLVGGEIDLLDDSRIRLRVCVPDIPEAAMEVIKDPSHCVIRAFGKFLSQGGLNTGKIWVLLAEHPNTTELRIMMALAVTNITGGTGMLKEKRLILFPRCILGKPTVWDVGDKGEPFSFNLHHMSVEAPRKGELHYHLTGVDGSHRDMSKLTERHEFGTVLGHLIIHRYDVLDGPGILIGTSTWKCNSPDLLERSRLAVKSALDGFHPIITMNHAQPWIQGMCMVATLAISDERKDPKTMKGPDIVLNSRPFLNTGIDRTFPANHRITQFPMADGLLLNVCTAIVKARPKADVTWIA